MILSRFKRLRERKWLKHRRGLSFVELIVSFLIVTITSVAVTSGIYFAHGQLRRERNKTRAVQLLKSEAEYWLARIHSAYPSPHEERVRAPREVLVYDNPVGENIIGSISHTGFVGRDDPETALDPDYYELRFEIRYIEPPIEPVWITPDAKPKEVVLDLVCPMILSAT
ncbi:hypothetical protein K8I28_02090 [bacterium]|nr:hypothetical protein [bacterium]